MTRLTSPAPEAGWLGRWFTAARRDGLLTALSAEPWHTLCAVLSFTARDGRRVFTLDQLALALGASRAVADERLRTLAAQQFRGGPVAHVECDSAGEVYGASLARIEFLSETEHHDPAVRSPHSDTTDDQLAAGLSELGLNPTQIDGLLQNYPAERIARQLGWLPARGARNPAALLIRAIEGDWEAPKEGR